MEKTNIKILTAYHKPDILFKNDMICPIHVGRDVLAQKTDEVSQKNLKALTDLMIGDNTGDNISNKNLYYNEMTALYWAWKNYSSLGDPQYIGLMHYRRHFDIKDMGQRSAYFECNNIKDSYDYLNNTIGLTQDALSNLLTANDFIVSKPYYKESVYKQYQEAHHAEELDLAISIIKEKYPKYYPSCEKYMNGNKVFFCNMFIFPKDIFFEYCDFIFGVLAEYEKQVDLTGKRLYISERITGTFVQYLLDLNKKACYIPTMYIEENITIPVAFATDANFIRPTFTAITSLLENAKPTTFYDIFIMVPSEIYDKISELSKLFYKQYKHFSIIIVNMGKLFNDIEMSIKHITAQTYYRLHLPRILQNYNKCLYLDSDIIVNTDLSVLFRLDISENYVGGVRAAGYYHPGSWVKQHTAELGIQSIDQYINAGILLLNLDRIRKEKIDELMLSYVEKGFSSQDQDIINVACYGHIRIFPLKFNLMTKYIRNNNGKMTFSPDDLAVYGKNEVEGAFQAPVIIHYADKVKPWDNPQIAFGDTWLKYDIISPLVRQRTKKKINVILPIYNMEEYLSECLNSVLGQTLSDIDVICVNDGSVDKSLDILKQYQKQYNNIFIINQTNHGVAHSRNVGLDFANSEFICFMDPDDFYPSNDILETLYNKAKQNNVKICGGSWSEVQEKDGVRIFKKVFGGMNGGYTFTKEQKMTYKNYQFDFGYHRFIYNLDMLRKNNIKFPLYTRFQDPPFFIKSMIAANEFYAIPKITYCYRLGCSHQTAKYNGKKINDLMLGLIDDLRISSRNNLQHLHRLTFDRINKVHAQLFFESATNGKNPYMFELLIRANTAVNRSLLKKEIDSINENSILEPLKRALNYYYSLKANQAKIQPINKHQTSKSVIKIKKIIPYLKKNGLKCTLIRIFKGSKAANKYIVSQKENKQ